MPYPSPHVANVRGGFDTYTRPEVRAMRKVEEIEEQIRDLSVTELAEFRKWFAEFDAQTWDRQIEAAVNAGKSDALAEAARRARRDGKSTEF